MKLIYVADPMCSWCYGFASTMDALLAAPGAAAPLQLALVMGGLRPHTTEPLSPGKAEEIFGHWRHVQEASGQPFAAAPHTALHQPGFIYDTEPASRAVVTVRSLWPRLVWRYFKSVQQAFYADALNVTQPGALADLAVKLNIPRGEFAAAFASSAQREATEQDFSQCHEWGIRAFPALVAEHDGALHLVSQGYAPVDVVRQRLDALITPLRP